MRRIAAVLPLTIVLLATSGPAPAAPSAGITRTELGRGTVDHTYQVGGQAGSDVVTQSVRIEPGGNSGWHTHPGAELAVIKAGTLTFFDGDDADCHPRSFSAGQVIARLGHPHLARNLGKEPVEIVVTYLDVPAGGPAAQPSDEPANCHGR
jgi:quercetin dioxygenase-like cupin family protein